MANYGTVKEVLAADLAKMAYEIVHGLNMVSLEPAFAGEPAQYRYYIGQMSDHAAEHYEAMLPNGYWLDMAHCPGEYCLCREANS